MKKEYYKKLTIIGIFAIAMAFLEATIVIYLRKIYYPSGFNFPLKGLIEPSILNVEWIREIFTILMLLCISLLAAKKLNERFAYFLYSFAIWDIFYYIWLKIILNWPYSLLTWDLLFLVPWPWIGPVIAPILLSITMLILSLCIVYCQDKNINIIIKIKTREWILLILGSLIILYTFLIDYGKLIFSGFTKDFFSLATNLELNKIISLYNPTNYNWFLFIIGELLLLVSIISFYLRNKR
ncbi:hypothetical protein HYW75_00295 [Candidatus Pacearchaeota archaeon]|nr:hypothetical protein [Candidatus Pacearchaeota archaeon]